MSTDQRHIRRIRQALAQLTQARSYQRQATRLVKAAEDELKSALVAATQPSQPPGKDGEKVAA